MTLTPDDIGFARNVIAGEIPFAVMARGTDLRNQVIVTVVTLHASEILEFSRFHTYGTFGRVLLQFCAPVGVEGLVWDEPVRERTQALRDISRDIGLHKMESRGNSRIVLVKQPLIAALLADGEVAQKAVRLAEPILAQCKIEQAQRFRRGTFADRWNREKEAIGAKWGVDIDSLRITDVEAFIGDLRLGMNHARKQS